MISAPNIILKFDSKTFIGVTAHNFNITNTIKESITRDGKKKSIISHPYTGSIEGVCELDSESSATKIDRDAAIALSLQNDAIDVIYSPGTGKSYTGSILISSYSEKAGADDELTYSLNFEDDGTALTIVTPPTGD
jgi:hypothetical protein